MRPLILASSSPRRREILQKLGLAFEVLPADLDETQAPGEAPELYVTRLAEAKARTVARVLPALLARGSARLPALLARGSARFDARAAVLGADTTVVLDHELLGKPCDAADSERMLRKLRAREHAVHTAVALLLWPEGEARVVCVTTRVRFRDFSDETLRRYVASGEGMDKAGSYGIQELGQGLVAELHGSYSNVVGLPAAETLELLEGSGVLAAWP